MENRPPQRALEQELAETRRLNELIEKVLSDMTRSSTGFSFKKREGETERDIRARVTEAINQSLRQHSSATGADLTRLRKALISHFMEHQRDYQARIDRRREILRSRMGMSDLFSLSEKEILLRDAERRTFPPDVEDEPSPQT